MVMNVVPWGWSDMKWRCKDLLFTNCPKMKKWIFDLLLYLFGAVYSGSVCPLLWPTLRCRTSLWLQWSRCTSRPGEAASTRATPGSGSTTSASWYSNQSDSKHFPKRLLIILIISEITDGRKSLYFAHYSLSNVIALALVTCDGHFFLYFFLYLFILHLKCCRQINFIGLLGQKYVGNPLK